MTLVDFKINLYDLVGREYASKSKAAATEPPRRMFSFTFSYTGRIEGEDPLLPRSYISSEHKGCMFYVQGGELDWGYAKTTTARGRQMNPSQAGEGLHQLVLTALVKTAEADVLREDIAARQTWGIPDASKYNSPRLEIV